MRQDSSGHGPSSTENVDKNNIKWIQLVKRQKSKLNESNTKSLIENPDKLSNTIKIKASIKTENTRPKTVVRKKTQPLSSYNHDRAEQRKI